MLSDTMATMQPLAIKAQVTVVILFTLVFPAVA